MHASLTLPKSRPHRTTAADALRQQIKEVQTIHASEGALIREAFEKKLPFVIDGAEQNPHGVDVDFLQAHLGDRQVTCFNPESNSEHMPLGTVPLM